MDGQRIVGAVTVPKPGDIVTPLERLNAEMMGAQADLQRLQKQVKAQQVEIESLKAAFKIIMSAVGRKELDERRGKA